MELEQVLQTQTDMPGWGRAEAREQERLSIRGNNNNLMLTLSATLLVCVSPA